MQIGIDFGTCYSTVAIMCGDLPVTNCVRDSTGQGVPSLFMHLADRDVDLFGEPCKYDTEAQKHPEDVIRNMKRLVRDNPANLDMEVVSGGRTYILRDIIERYITFLIDEAKKGAEAQGEIGNTEIEEITITAPIGIEGGAMMASDYNSLLMEIVKKITGLAESHIHIAREPVAAAISYLYSQNIKQQYADDQTVLIFDLGGGTLDVTIVKHDIHKMEYEIITKKGDLRLGGNDWDEALGRMILTKTGTGSFADSGEESNFWDMVTKLKIDLTTSEKGMIFFNVDGEDVFLKVTREEFEGLTKDLLSRSVEVMKAAIADYVPGLDGIDKIVLVGGSCNMPQIRNGIIDAFPEISEDDVCIYEPSKAIAKGAAVYSRLCAFRGGIGGGGIREKTDCTYGFRAVYHGGDTMIYNMIFAGDEFSKDNKVHAKTEGSFNAIRDEQTSVVFTIFESVGKRDEGGPEAGWMALDKGHINGLEVEVKIPAAFIGKATDYALWPELSLSRNGILEITIKDGQGKKVGYSTNAQVE